MIELLDIYIYIRKMEASWVAQLISKPPASAGDPRDMGSISGSGRSLWKENGNLLQYSCWKIPWTEDPDML